jgi:hypothetical protein
MASPEVGGFDRFGVAMSLMCEIIEPQMKRHWRFCSHFARVE